MNRKYAPYQQTLSPDEIQQNDLLRSCGLLLSKRGVCILSEILRDSQDAAEAMKILGQVIPLAVRCTRQAHDPCRIEDRLIDLDPFIIELLCQGLGVLIVRLIKRHQQMGSVA